MLGEGLLLGVTGYLFQNEQIKSKVWVKVYWCLGVTGYLFQNEQIKAMPIGISNSKTALIIDT